MTLIHPDKFTQPLQSGDEVITVAPSSIINDEDSISEGIQVLQDWGLICRKHNIVKRSWGYLSGNDLARYNELHPQKAAELIACARGGWGAARLLEHSPRWRNGWLLGFSDITSLLLSRLAYGFDGGIHGPLISTLAKEPEWSKERLHSLLFGRSVPDLAGESWRGGVAEGPLIVANLTVATHLLGSSHLPSLKGAILILEDINEEPYRIDRMLTQWRLAGLLQELSGIGFGCFHGCDAKKEENNSTTFKLNEVLKERVFDLNIPVIGSLPIGHCIGNAALPLGRIARIDGQKGSLTLLP